MPAVVKRSKMDHQLAKKCREVVEKKAREYGIPPVYITAHIRLLLADRARVEVWRVMVYELGMTRQLVADIFRRDRRRLRASVIGGPTKSLPPVRVTG